MTEENNTENKNMLDNISKKKIKKQNINTAKINRILDSAYYRSQSGKPKYNERVHYSKLLKEENNKSPDKKGTLYYQENENTLILKKLRKI